MAALYLHNAFWNPAQSESASVGRNKFHRIHHLPSLSRSTLRTATSEPSSHPTEPLLRSTTSESLAYLDLLSRQPTHPNGPQAGWDLGLNFEGDQTTMQERKGYRDQELRRRIRRLRMAKSILELVMGGWAIYNLVRYFRAYTTYTSLTGLAVSLSLGTAATLSLAFLMASALLSMFRQYLEMHQIPLSYLHFVGNALTYLSSFLLLAPALVSFALVFVWRNSSDSQLQLQNRCYLDIDVVWSITTTICDRVPSWGLLLVLSIIRVILTFLNILFYHLLSSEYHTVRRPRRKRKSYSRVRRPVLPTVAPPPSSAPPLTGSSSSSLSTLTPPSRTSIPSLWRQLNHTGDQRGLRTSLSRGSIPRNARSGTQSPGGTGARLTPESPRSIEQDLSDPSDIYADFDPAMPRGPDDAEELPPDSGGELGGFVDHFRSVVSQIRQETEEALDLTNPNSYALPLRSSSANPSPYSARPYSDVAIEDPFNPYVEYDQYSHLTQPDEHVPSVGGFVRRMPTIASLGSREMGSTDHHGDPSRSSNHGPSSRPPTRSGTSSSSSHTNSLYTNMSHQLLVVDEQGDVGAAAEVGETVPRVSEDSEAVSISYHTAASTPSPIPPAYRS